MNLLWGDATPRSSRERQVLGGIFFELTARAIHSTQVTLCISIVKKGGELKNIFFSLRDLYRHEILADNLTVQWNNSG